MYIHQRADWPRFRWRLDALAEPLAAVRHFQGRLAGRLEALGLTATQRIVLEAISDEVQRSGEIEGEALGRDMVRSSVARRLGIDIGALTPADSRVEGVVAMAIDATQRFAEPLTPERLHGWQAAMFPTGRSGLTRIAVGAWRSDLTGPMQVVSGRPGREHVHFVAPSAERVAGEMDALLEWFNADDSMDGVLKAALAHLWFVTIHPYDDGNGRIARAIADMALACAEGSSLRCYSLSAQIRRERREYYAMLEETQAGDLDITGWMAWSIGCLHRALQGAEVVVDGVLARARFWDDLAEVDLSERQRKALGKLLEGLRGHLTTRKWAALAGCSHDTALRDIRDLISKGVLAEGPSGGRSTQYRLRGWPPSGGAEE